MFRSASIHESGPQNDVKRLQGEDVRQCVFEVGKAVRHQEAQGTHRKAQNWRNIQLLIYNISE
jgi:hypothetical protein